MHRILTGSVVGALLSLALLVPGSASAATAPSVFVRVEGASATLLPQTVVQTTSASTVRGQPCAGSSAAGALDIASQGHWSASFDAKFHDFFVSSIFGETPPSASAYWSLWINGMSSQTGACQTPLHPGDHELWFDCLPDANFNCTNNPLAITLPTTARLGRPLDATVYQLDGNGHSTPVAGATINGGGVLAVTGGDGKASIVPHSTGVIRLHAVKSGATPSDTVFLCVYARRAKECGSAGRNGPRVRVIGIRQHQVFRGTGPRSLHGTAGPDPAGITNVSLRLTRRSPAGRCSYYDASRAAWTRYRCGTRPANAGFTVSATTTWAYLLPKTLAAGRYTLQVIATDGQGRATKAAKGRSVIEFRVRK